MAHDVFISYSSKDKLTADAACARLESGGIRCWIAPRDISPGQDWGEAIVDAIGQSRVMVLVFSSGANESQQIKREVERAVNKGVTIIPMRIEDVVPNRSLEYFISTPHWLDAMTPPLEKHLDLLLTTLQHILNSGPVLQPVPHKTSLAVRNRRMGAFLPYAVALILVAAGVGVAWKWRSPATDQSVSTSHTPISNMAAIQRSVWKGTWSDPVKTTYDFWLDLANDNGAISGQFKWILRYAAPSSGSRNQPEGSSETEEVKGRYDPETGEVEMSGRSVSNNKAIAMGSYRFKLADDGKSFKGTELGHQGQWLNTIAGTLTSGTLSFGSAAGRAAERK